MKRPLLALHLALALTTFGCDDDDSSADTAAGTAADDDGDADGDAADGDMADEDSGDGGEVTWPDMTPEERSAYMGSVVVPAMAALWAESASPDTVVGCATCHGEGASTGDFTMPNPGLPQLDPTNNFEAHQASPLLDFMMTQVTPEMTELLDAEPFNPETNEGFGCFACHTPAG